MDTIVIFRKAKLGKALTQAQIESELQRYVDRKMVRVPRNQTLSFVLGVGFRKLPIVPAAVLDSPCGPMDAFANGEGWEIPASELGRSGQVTKQTADSIKSQIAKLTGLDPADFSVCVVSKG